VAVKGVFEFFQETLVGGAVNRTVFDLRNRFYRLAIHQDVRQVQEAGTAELMTRVTNDLEQVGGGMKILCGKVVVETFKAVAFVFAAAFISWRLTLLFVCLVVPAAVVMGRVSRLMKKASRKVLDRMGDLYKIARETFDGIRVLKAFTMEPAERVRFRKANENYYRKSMRVLRLDALTGPLLELFGIAAVGLPLLAGAYLVMNKTDAVPIGPVRLQLHEGELSFEALIQLYLFLGMVADPVRRLASVYSKIQTGAAAADRVYALADKTPRVTANADGPTVPKHADRIEFRNVCFSYVPGQVPGTLNGIDLTVEAGETVAIVGPNGCGKSTLLSLLPRFFDPDHGAVLVDGVNLRNGTLRSLRKQVGIVSQDTVLFNDTIAGSRSRRRRSRRSPTSSSSPSRSATTSRSGTPAASCPAGRSSGSPWPGPSSATPAS
jgi:ATP-binding cassette subfamily B protein/subfamily B ATP-binding cassette protein MsbA